MTIIGELAPVQQAFQPLTQFEVIAMEGWRREMYAAAAPAPWVMPSPNLTLNRRWHLRGGAVRRDERVGGPRHDEAVELIRHAGIVAGDSGRFESPESSRGVLPSRRLGKSRISSMPGRAARVVEYVVNRRAFPSP